MTLIRCLKIGFTLLLLCPGVALASDRKGYGDVEVLEVVSVYDADTFRVNIAGWPDIIGANIAIRADGFDAPEIRGQCPEEKENALVARNLTFIALSTADRVLLRNIRRGKYFRIIADVYVDGESLRDLHLTAGTARPYSGGKREGWCN